MGKRKKELSPKEAKKARDAKLVKLKERAKKNRAALKSLKKRETNAQRLYDEIEAEYATKIETRERRLVTARSRAGKTAKRLNYIKLQISLIDDPLATKKLARERHLRAAAEIDVEIAKA